MTDIKIIPIGKDEFDPSHHRHLPTEVDVKKGDSVWMPNDEGKWRKGTGRGEFYFWMSLGIAAEDKAANEPLEVVPFGAPDKYRLVAVRLHRYTGYRVSNTQGTWVKVKHEKLEMQVIRQMVQPDEILIISGERFAIIEEVNFKRLIQAGDYTSAMWILFDA